MLLHRGLGAGKAEATVVRGFGMLESEGCLGSVEDVVWDLFGKLGSMVSKWGMTYLY